MENEPKPNESSPEEQVASVEKSKKAKKRSKNKKSASQEKTSETPQNSSIDQAENETGLSSLGANQADVLKTLQALNLTDMMKFGKEGENSSKVYKFWNTQPVPKIDEALDDASQSDIHKAIEPDKPISEIKQEPYALPEGFFWDTLDLNNEVTLKELYTLLNENYVEDDDSMFRFDYQPEFLRWALQPPDWRKEWQVSIAFFYFHMNLILMLLYRHAGVRVTKSGRLIAFISAIPATIRIYEKQLKVVEINFLCVHKKLRSKRLAPVLIREITRRVNLTGIFQAVYTAGVVLPKPVTTCRYWHRSLNPRKLIEVMTIN